jgi:hypothetical protein
MKAGGHPVVTRGQLDGLSRKFEVLRERLALAMRTTGNKERACARLLRRVLGFPDRVHRGDFLAVSAWEPMLGPVFMDLYLAIRTELIRLLPLNTYSNGITDGKKVLGSMYLIAGAARGAPEQFYFPPDLMDAQHLPWKPEYTRHLLEPIRMAEHASRPVAPPRRGPGPNEPCTCGSGRKSPLPCQIGGCPSVLALAWYNNVPPRGRAS